jgi:cysteine desulfurase
MEFSVSARKIQRAARHLAVASPRSDNPPDEMTQVLRAIGSAPSEVARTIRFSVGWTTTRDQIDRAVELLADAFESSSSH